MPQPSEDPLDSRELAGALDDYECIWRGRVVWKHMLAQRTVAVSPYYQVVRDGNADIADQVRDAVHAKWQRAGGPLDIAAGISEHDPQLTKYVEVELVFDANAR